MDSKKIHNEFKKIKKMNNSDRLWYIWSYYKLPILGFLLAAFIIYEAAACIYRNFQDTMLYCIALNETSLSSGQLSPVMKEFDEACGFNETWKQNTFFDCSMSIDDPNQAISDAMYNNASTIKLEALLSTDTMDVLITVPQMFTYLSSQHMFISLNEALPEELYSSLEENDLLIWSDDIDGNSAPLGIDLDNSWLATQVSLQEGSSLSVCTLANHPDIIAEYIRFILWRQIS